MYENIIVESAEYIKNKTKYAPKIGIILGSGLGGYADGLPDAKYYNYKDIPNFPISTVDGHKGQFVLSEKVVCMQGRFHFYEGYTMQEVTFPIRVMKLLGVKTLIVTNAAGGINEKYMPGDLMIITDHINLMGTNPLIGDNYDGFGSRFPDMSNCYDHAYISIAENVGRDIGLSLRKGVYTAFTGPSFETPAEVKMARILGGDAVGMSTVPEVIVACHSGLRVLGISCITNHAAGIKKTPLNHNEVIEITNKAKSKFIELISGIVEKL